MNATKVASSLLTGILLLVISAAPARAWVAWECCVFGDCDWITWDDEPSYRVAFSGGGAPASATQDVMTKWNWNPSNFDDFRVRNFDEGSVSFGNGQNELWFSSNDGILDGAAAVTRMERDACGLGVEWTEADVTVDNRLNWTYSAAKTCTSAYFDSTAFCPDFDGDGVVDGNDQQLSYHAMLTHELGHALGLAHENDEYNVMGLSWNSMSTNGLHGLVYPGEDASDGAVGLYGSSAVDREDVGVAHWKCATPSCASGEYSSHSRTVILAGDDEEVDDLGIVNGEPAYEVARGSTILVEFTYENNGSSTQDSVDVGFYISEDEWISNLDDRFAGATLGLARNGVYTPRSSLTVPNDLVVGRYYWLGVIVDEDDVIDEVDESNNATYIRIRAR